LAFDFNICDMMGNISWEKHNLLMFVRVAAVTAVCCANICECI